MRRQVCEGNRHLHGQDDQGTHRFFSLNSIHGQAKGGSITIEDGKLKVTSADGCGAGWLIFDGVSKLVGMCCSALLLDLYSLVDALSTFVKEVPELYPKIEQFVEESKALPDKIQSEAQGLGNPMKVPGIVKNGMLLLFSLFALSHS